MITQETRIKIQESIGDGVTAPEADEFLQPTWVAWPVSWSGVWVGSLATIAAVAVFGLIGTALGAHLVGPENRVVDLHDVTLTTLIVSMFGAFFACVIGGWVAAKIAGIRRSEPAMLHGAITWLIAVPILIALAAIGAGSYFGGWYGGLAGSPSWAARAEAPFDRPDALSPVATQAEVNQYVTEQSEYRAKVRQWREDTPRATRNSALGAVTALLIGLVGSVIGGWMASGEPMSLTYYRTRANQQSRAA